MVFYKQIMWTGAPGSWSVLQLQGWWQTKQRLPCRRPALQKMINIKHQIWLIPLLTQFSPWDFEGKRCLPAGPAHEKGTWQWPTVLLPKMPSSWFHTTSCSSDLVSAHSFESLSHTGTDRSRIHSVNALGALPFQLLPSGVGRSLRASEWQLAHQHTEMETFLSWVREMALFFLLQQLTY